MKKEHISFNKISDLYDKNILSRTEAETIQKHLERCDICKGEYDDLDRMTKMLISMRSLGIRNEGEFINNTITEIKNRREIKRRRSLIKYSYLSAIAAAIVIVTTVGLYNLLTTQYRGDQITENLGKLEKEYKDEDYLLRENFGVLKTNFDIGRVVLILEKNNAKISDIVDRHVEGEISLSDYRKLQRELNSQTVNESIEKKGKNILETVKFDPAISDQDWVSLIDEDPTVEFRVNLK